MATEKEFMEEYNLCVGVKPKANLQLLEMPNGASPIGGPTMQNGTLVFANQNSVTSVQNGQIIKDDGTIKITENVGANETRVQKPNETVDI